MSRKKTLQRFYTSRSLEKKYYTACKKDYILCSVALEVVKVFSDGLGDSEFITEGHKNTDGVLSKLNRQQAVEKEKFGWLHYGIMGVLLGLDK